MLLRLALWALGAVLLPTQQVYGGPDGAGSYLWLRPFGVAAGPWWPLASLAAFSLTLACLLVALRWMTGAPGRCCSDECVPVLVGVGCLCCGN